MNEYVQFVNLLQKVGYSRRIQLLMRKDNYSSLCQLPFPHNLEQFFVNCIQMSANSKMYDLFDIPTYSPRSICRFKQIVNLASDYTYEDLNHIGESVNSMHKDVFVKSQELCKQISSIIASQVEDN